MAQVTVTIDGRTYRMACEEGQEEHLTDLATKLDGYVSHLKGQFGEIGDQRLTVMAGIMVLDELEEMRGRFRGIESELDTLRKTRDMALDRAEKADKALAAALGDVANQVEGITAKLNGAPSKAGSSKAGEGSAGS